MSVHVDDARTDYEDALALQTFAIAAGTDANQAQAKRAVMRASQDYAQALVDDQLRKFDGRGIKVGETTVIGDSRQPFVIGELVADVPAGRVKAWSDSGGGWDWADELRPYTATEENQLVLESHSGDTFVDPKRLNLPHYRLTLSNVTPADLDAMKQGEVIEGTFKIEGVGK